MYSDQHCDCRHKGHISDQFNLIEEPLLSGRTFRAKTFTLKDTKVMSEGSPGPENSCDVLKQQSAAIKDIDPASVAI